MNKLLLLSMLCCFTLPGCLETRVVRDGSVASQFMRLDGVNGARVQIGDGSAQAKERDQQRAKLMASKKDTYNPDWKPLGNATFKTNFKVDQDDPNAAKVAPAAPPPGMPMMDGVMRPDMLTEQPAK